MKRREYWQRTQMGFLCTGRFGPSIAEIQREITVTVGNPFMNVHWKMLGVLGSLLSPLHKNESMSSFFFFVFNIK